MSTAANDADITLITTWAEVIDVCPSGSRAEHHETRASTIANLTGAGSGAPFNHII